MIMINTYMRKFINNLRSNAGFTLIELLVVIGILGILAAALLATVDPFEQLKKGRDTTTRNTAIEYLNALTRYYSTHGQLPWNNNVDACTALAPTTAKYLSTMGACTTLLINDGELKVGFDNAIKNSGVESEIEVYTSSATGSDVNLCFSPTSKALKADGLTINGPDCKVATPPGVANCDTLDERQKAADGICWQVFK
ncbi:MAG: hypothetical protein UR81_C0027G0004 [Candidatus Levybacteria bacterium GW2011_GWB1_35_5]|nr:MAG: hypothetical protein UR81_C0027G0004 [Candidatus Levybacteria bacterium GW2011_GWB1_35_5]